jgi:D-arabinose 1-dehydrogenase-like Zn-dependent alcohol dehydrogenase
MRAVIVPSPGAAFEIVEREIPEPGSGEVRVRVDACGLCHSDLFVKEGAFPGIAYPRVPGHEIAGAVDAVGEGVTEWSAGDRVGVGWHGGHCFTCGPCRTGDFVMCENAKIAGISYDGGYADYLVAPHEALARIPDDLGAIDAAPLLCAGITTFNALRNSGARPGDLVAIQGVGGLGHLGVQYARRMGFHTVALSRGEDKRQLALDLGAHAYIDAKAEDAAAALQAMGGARVILATAPSTDAINSVVGGLGTHGQLIIVGVDQGEVKASPMVLIGGDRAVSGWSSGTAKDSEDTLRFSDLMDVRPEVEVFPLEEAAAAYDRMMSGDARFRVVLDVAGSRA